MRRRWRWYTTSRGRPVVKEDLEAVPRDARFAVLRVLKRIQEGQPFEHDLEKINEDIHAARVFFDGSTYRVLFSHEGKSDAILLALHLVQKKDRKLDPKALGLAQRRLADWRARGTRNTS